MHIVSWFINRVVYTFEFFYMVGLSIVVICSVDWKKHEEALKDINEGV